LYVFVIFIPTTIRPQQNTTISQDAELKAKIINTTLITLRRKGNWHISRIRVHVGNCKQMSNSVTYCVSDDVNKVLCHTQSAFKWTSETASHIICKWPPNVTQNLDVKENADLCYL